MGTETKKNETKKNESQFAKADKAIAAAAEACEPLPCARETKPGENCIRQAHALEMDDEGRTPFWYGPDCRLPAERFCSSCIAYWLIAVARNELMHAKRVAEAA